MAKSNLKQTYFVISTNAAETEDGMCLDELWLLGWDNKYDWYADDIDSQDLLTPTGRLKKTDGVCCIQIDRWVGCYVDDNQKWMAETCQSAIDEGYDCCLCRLEKDAEGAIRVYKV